jgi:predicted alpha/beta hydrolase family esterase
MSPFGPSDARRPLKADLAAPVPPLRTAHEAPAPAMTSARARFPGRPLLLAPGVNGSGPEHWQSRWQRELPGARRAEQADWDAPRLSEWVAGLDAAVEQCPGAVLVAHSLGCALVVHWAAATGGRAVAGALLAAPADVEADSPRCRALAGFAPLPRRPLPFPAVLVASRNDPYMGLGRAAALSAEWSARFEDAGTVGHINVASGHGPWAEGLALLDRFLGRIEANSAA